MNRPQCRASPYRSSSVGAMMYVGMTTLMTWLARPGVISMSAILLLPRSMCLRLLKLTETLRGRPLETSLLQQAQQEATRKRTCVHTWQYSKAAVSSSFSSFWFKFACSCCLSSLSLQSPASVSPQCHLNRRFFPFLVKLKLLRQQKHRRRRQQLQS